MPSKIKALAKKYEKITKVLLMLATLVLISVVSMLLLYLFDIIYFDDGIQINKELFDSFKLTWYGWIIIILFQIVVTSLLSFVPGASMAFILLLQALYANPPIAFAVAFSGVMLSSFMLYVLGRFGGYTLCKKILGEDDIVKASDLLNNKGTVYFPIMMMFPIFPDDALTMVAGTLKMSLKWFIPSIVIGRGIGVAAIVFGVSIVPFDKFTTPWHWIIFILLCALGIAAVFFAASRFNKFMEKKRNANKVEEAETEKETEKV